MKKQISFICFLFFLSLFFIGCQQEEGTNNNNEDFSANESAIISQELAKEVKRNVSKLEEVDDVVAVNYHDNVYVALSVSGFQRFFLKQIQKDAHELAKKISGVKAAHVSTDRKIIMVLEELEEQIYRGELTEKQVEKKLKKVEEDMKG